MNEKKDQQLRHCSSFSKPRNNIASLNGEDKKHDEKSKKPINNSPPNKNNTPSQYHQNVSHNGQNMNQMSTSTTQWHPQFQNQMNVGGHQPHQFPVPPPLVPSHHPASMPHPCQPFPQPGSCDNNWPQVPPGAGGFGHCPIPNGFYPFGFLYPSCSGPWDPSWWGQMQRFPPFGCYPLPGVCHHFSSLAPQPTTNTSFALGNSSNKEGVEPSANNSHIHQQFWNAELAENARLWNVITGLQADLTDVRSRLMNFETEIKSLKSLGEQQTARNTETTRNGQTIKKRKPEMLVSSIKPLSSPNHLRQKVPIPRIAPSKPPPTIKVVNFKKDDKYKAEFVEGMSQMIHPNFFTKTDNPTYANIKGNTVVRNNSFQVPPKVKMNLMMNATSQGNYRPVNVPDQGATWNMVNEGYGDSENLNQAKEESDEEDSSDSNEE